VKWKDYRRTNPEYYYTMFEGLISEGQRGRIYSGWSPITDEEYGLIEAREVYALDFGYMALAAFKVVNTKFYAKELFYDRVGLKELAIRMCTLGFTGAHLIIADSEDGISINKLRMGWQQQELTEKEIELYPQMLRGFDVLGAIKGPGSVDFGIGVMKGLEWYVTEGSKNFWNEYREYKWALDKDKNPTNTPDERTPHHLLDDARYVAVARGRLF
jgi:phage terminase large subunit